MEDDFHVQGMPINFLSIYRVGWKGYKFEVWLGKYVLKYIKHNFKVVSFGHVDHEVGLYKFPSLNSPKNQPFYSYVAHANEKANYEMKYWGTWYMVICNC